VTVPDRPRPHPGDRPRPRPSSPGLGTRTATRQARATRASTIAAASIVVLGVVVAAVLVVLDREHNSGAGGSGAAIAAPPTFGASLPISAPAGSPSAPAGSSAADAQFADPGAVSDLLAAASRTVQLVDSYDYRTLGRDQAAGDAVSTGDFRTRYDASLRGLRSSAPKNHTVQQAVVQKLAVTALSGDTAGVLVFGRLEITDSANPDGTTTVLASGVTLERAGATWRINDMTDLADQGTFAATPPGNAALLAAVTAGAREVVNLLSYTRASFDADYNRALDGLTGPLRTQQEQRRAGLEQSMNQTQTDYAGQVRSVGVESASGTSVLLLVCATGYAEQARSAHPVSGTERFEVGVQYVGRRWLVNEYLALPSTG
jgi:hypothetical protein